jgi:hypothetical protein
MKGFDYNAVTVASNSFDHAHRFRWQRILYYRLACALLRFFPIVEQSNVSSTSVGTGTNGRNGTATTIVFARPHAAHGRLDAERFYGPSFEKCTISESIRKPLEPRSAAVATACEPASRTKESFPAT